MCVNIWIIKRGLTNNQSISKISLKVSPINLVNLTCYNHVLHRKKFLCTFSTKPQVFNTSNDSYPDKSTSESISILRRLVTWIRQINIIKQMLGSDRHHDRFYLYFVVADTGPGRSPPWKWKSFTSATGNCYNTSAQKKNTSTFSHDVAKFSVGEKSTEIIFNNGIIA